LAVVLGIIFTLYGLGMSVWATARHDATPTDYALYGFLALVGIALLVKTVRDRRRTRRNR
jgi:hypothetical protein